MKFREANKVDRKSGGSPIKGLSFFPAIATGSSTLSGLAIKIDYT